MPSARQCFHTEKQFWEEKPLTDFCVLGNGTFGCRLREHYGQQEAKPFAAARGNGKAAYIGSMIFLAGFHLGVRCRASTQRGSACQQPKIEDV